MILLPLLLQTTPVQPMPKGTALPPPAGGEAAVLAPVEAMFAAIGAGDGAALLAQVRPEGRATVAAERPDGGRSVRGFSWSDFAARLKPGPDRVVERFVGRPAVEIDGDIAMVWGAYELTVNGRRMHCGVDHFDLVRDGGAWKILNVTWSQRTEGCTPA